MKLSVEGCEYDYDPASLTNKEAMAIEGALGVTFKQWSEQLTAGSVSALTALVWTVQKRDEPALRFDAVDFAFAELEIEDEAPDPTPPEESGS